MSNEQQVISRTVSRLGFVNVPILATEAKISLEMATIALEQMVGNKKLIVTCLGTYCEYRPIIRSRYKVSDIRFCPQCGKKCADTYHLGVHQRWAHSEANYRTSNGDWYDQNISISNLLP